MTATHPRPARWTYEEFARLPEDGNRYEIIAGELYVTPAPRPRHQLVLVPLIVQLNAFVAKHGLGRIYPGPIDVLFAEGDYLEPDLVFVRQDRFGIVSDRGLEGAPNLVVEILSPSTARRDRTLKRDRYAFFGVSEYWVIDPEGRTVEVFRAGTNQSAMHTATLEWQPVTGGPELTLRVSDLFETS
jgi:Uma2 family endonuclease